MDIWWVNSRLFSGRVDLYSLRTSAEAKRFLTLLCMLTSKRRHSERGVHIHPDNPIFGYSSNEGVHKLTDPAGFFTNWM